MFAKFLLSNSEPELTNILVIPAFSGYSFFKIFPNLNCPALLNADVDIVLKAYLVVSLLMNPYASEPDGLLTFNS